MRSKRSHYPPQTQPDILNVNLRCQYDESVLWDLYFCLIVLTRSSSLLRRMKQLSKIKKEQAAGGDE
jgi:hypothetical protein